MRNLELDLCTSHDATVRNLWFYPTEDLGAYASSREPEEDRVICIAELFVRDFLKRGNAEAEINRVLPDGELKQFLRTLDEDFLDLRDKAEVLGGNLWECKSNFSRKCHAAVRARLLSLCIDTDGFIPVVYGEDAFFIPFRFAPGAPVIEDFAGKAIDCWQTPYGELFAAAEVRYKCVVHCDQSLVPLSGRSLMLPVYLAYLRKIGEIQYNPLRLLATGAVENGRLASVETAEKASALKKCFPGAVLLFPESSKYCSEKRNEIPLPPLELAKVKEAVQRHIDYHGLCVPTLEYALARLKKLYSELGSNYRSWELMLRCVEKNARAVPRYCDPENYLLCLMLKSSINCHLGNTRVALALNREARELAKRNNLTREQLRLEIEELVEFQDEECFLDIAAQAEQLKVRVEEFGDPDLLMRYYGTMGQAHCYGFLAGVTGFDRDRAKSCFVAAVDYALKRPRDIENEMDFQGNVAQDLNYCYLWYALFEPETADADRAFAEAKNHHECRLGGEKQIRNRRHLKRLKAFALYRRWLADGAVPEPEKIPNALKSEFDGDWLAATTGKYVGALLAAAGNFNEAADTFKEYTDILRKRTEPILRFIQMTILAEAYRSIGEASYRKEALEVSELLKTSYSPSIGAWIDFLNGKSAFPGLTYWY